MADNSCFILQPVHRYVHVLVQKMAVNADLGFLLAVVAFLSAEQTTPQLEVTEEKERERDSRQISYMC